jgi:hypothetical protein
MAASREPISRSRVGTSKIPPELGQTALQSVRIQRQEVGGLRFSHKVGRKVGARGRGVKE